MKMAGRGGGGGCAARSDHETLTREVMRRSRWVKLVPALLLGCLVAGILAQVKALQFWRSAQSDLLEKGYAAMKQNDMFTAAVVADSLERRGYAPSLTCCAASCG